jgi:hypothetical protein
MPAEQLAQHAVQQAYESREEYHWDGVDPDVADWSLFDAHDHITSVDEVTTDQRYAPDFDEADEYDEPLTGLHVVCEQTGYVSERVSRGTRLEPPEYKNHQVPIRVEAWWFPLPDQLAPLTGIRADQEADPLGPPDPDVHAAMYDL